MDIPEAFVLKNLGEKLEVVPYFTRGTLATLRYRITVRWFAPPTTLSFTVTPQDLKALGAWIDDALSLNPPYVETYQDD